MKTFKPPVNCLLVGAVVAIVVHGSRADILTQQPDTDFFVIEAEDFDSLDGNERTGFLVVDKSAALTTGFGSDVLPANSNVSGSALYDPRGGRRFSDRATWKLHFSTGGLYTLYVRYSLYEQGVEETTYLNEDSIYLPVELGTIPNEAADGQDGRLTFPKLGHNSPHEDPPFWEGQFHWAAPATTTIGPTLYEVSANSVVDFTIANREPGAALDAFIFSKDAQLTIDDLDALLLEHGGVTTETVLFPGDANMDLKFDQFDLVQVQVAAKYLTGNSATWGEGDWDAAPAGTPGNPPVGNGLFDQVDIVAALGMAHYLAGPYAAISANGQSGDSQASIVYDPRSGELAVDAPTGVELTSINVDSGSGIFTGDVAQNLGGSFDNDADSNIFKATFGGSFGSLTFGNVAQKGLTEQFLLNDLMIVGSLAGGGDLGTVDLIYVPEPTSILLLFIGLVVASVTVQCSRRTRSNRLRDPCRASPFFATRNGCRAENAT